MLFEVPCRDKVDSWTSLSCSSKKRCFFSMIQFSPKHIQQDRTFPFPSSFSLKGSQEASFSAVTEMESKHSCLTALFYLFFLKKSVSVSLFQFLDLFHQDFVASICAYEDCERSSLFNIFLILHVAVLDIRLFAPSLTLQSSLCFLLTISLGDC